MHLQFGQKKLIPQVLVNLIWSYDDRYKILFRDCVDELNKTFFRNRLKYRLSMDYQLYKTVCRSYFSIFAYSRRFNLNNLMSDTSFSYYILNRIYTFGDRVPNENLPHFQFKNRP
jgi:hypothetical protein